MPTRGTKQTQVRLTEEDKERVERIRRHYAFRSGADAIRYALKIAARKIPKKSEEDP